MFSIEFVTLTCSAAESYEVNLFQGLSSKKDADHEVATRQFKKLALLVKQVQLTIGIEKRILN